MTKRTPRRSPIPRELAIERDVVRVLDRKAAIGTVPVVRFVDVSVAKVRALAEGPRA